MMSEILSRERVSEMRKKVGAALNRPVVDAVTRSAAEMAALINSHEALRKRVEDGTMTKVLTREEAAKASIDDLCRSHEALRAVSDAAIAYCDHLSSFNDLTHPEVHRRRLELAKVVSAAQGGEEKYRVEDVG